MRYCDAGDATAASAIGFSKAKITMIVIRCSCDDNLFAVEADVGEHFQRKAAFQISRGEAFLFVVSVQSVIF